MRNFKNVLAVVLFMMGATLFAQTNLSGKVVDENNQPLPGADIIVVGTTQGSSSDFDGNFTFDTNETSGTISVGFMGYVTKKITFNGATNFGTVKLNASSESLDEVIIVGVADIAKDRETPVAVSTIKASEISEKLGTQEFPEILKSTPSVYATKSGGGFGDARINIRGFSQENVAVMINGMPVNDMENSRVYWSNWAGLSDVTSAMQVQRGLGSSKLAISSVGGTINVLTKTSEQKEGGSVMAVMGEDNYQKYMATYSTGLMDSGFSASVLLSRTAGDGYVDGTYFEGHNYFIGLGYRVNDKNSLMFTFTGAPQYHGQHSRAIEISTHQKYGEDGEINRKYNDSWGYLNGEEFNYRQNFYHKPIMSLNWDWNISENSSLSTVAYGSWGRGGGSGPIGKINGSGDYSSTFKDENGLIRFDDIAAWNSGVDVPDFGDQRTGDFINDRGDGFTRRASMNSHDWYGVIVNFHNEPTENFSWDFGVDARTYTGYHYRVASDLLGASGYTDDRDINNPDRMITDFIEPKPEWNPWANITDQQKIEYYNVGGVNWLGAFGQIEYKTDNVSAFLQGGASQQGFQRTDYFNLEPAEQESDFENILGGNVKAGINYNINEYHNVFANTGYYLKQPFFSAVYPSYNTNDVNEGLTNEKVLGIEFGYGLRIENYRANLNLYRTSWKDRFLRQSRTGQDGFIDFEGIEQVHVGVELESSLKFNKLQIDIMGSLGDWQYQGNVTGTEYDEFNQLVGESNEVFYLDGVKVGDAAQFTARLGLTYNILDNLKVNIDHTFADKLYAQIDADSFSDPDHLGSLQLPSYSLLDAGVSYKLNLKSAGSLNFRFNVNNIMDHLYMSESQTNYHPGEKYNDDTYMGINTANRVYWGFGRQMSLSLKYNF